MKMTNDYLLHNHEYISNYKLKLNQLIKTSSINKA